jgi:hypothetical protein
VTAGRHATRRVALVLVAWLVGPMVWAGPAAAQGTVETQKGPPPAPAPLAPESAPPPTASPERPAVEPQPGKPALAPKPGAVDERGRPLPSGRRILGLRPPVLIGLGVVLFLVLAAGAVRRRSRVH